MPIPTQGSRRKPDWVRDEVVKLKAQMPDVGVRSVAASFNRLHGERVTVGKSFVAKVLQERQYQLAQLQRAFRLRPPKAYPVNAVWALDFTFQRDGKGESHAVLGLIDHGSRVLLRLERLTNRAAWMVLGHLCLAIGEFGKPKAIRTDNEAVFKSRLLNVALQLFGIRHQYSQPYSPWQNGRIERLFGTLKPLLRKLALPDGRSLDWALLEFRLFYNHVRPHQNLEGRTPAEVWCEATNEQIKRPKRVSALGGLLVGYYVRR